MNKMIINLLFWFIHSYLKDEKDLFNSKNSHNDHHDVHENAIFVITHLNCGNIIRYNINILSKSCEENNYQICFNQK